MAAATHEDVAAALGRPITTDDEVNQVQWWLEGAEIVLGARLGPLSGLDQGLLRYVEAEAVAAKARRHANTESSVTVTVDDGSVTRRYENPVSASDITDEWWHLLNPAAAVSAFSISPYATRQRPVRDCYWQERWL